MINYIRRYFQSTHSCMHQQNSQNQSQKSNDIQLPQQQLDKSQKLQFAQKKETQPHQLQNLNQQKQELQDQSKQKNDSNTEKDGGVEEMLPENNLTKFAQSFLEQSHSSNEFDPKFNLNLSQNQSPSTNTTNKTITRTTTTKSIANEQTRQQAMQGDRRKVEPANISNIIEEFIKLTKIMAEIADKHIENIPFFSSDKTGMPNIIADIYEKLANIGASYADVKNPKLVQLIDAFNFLMKIDNLYDFQIVDTELTTFFRALVDLQIVFTQDQKKSINQTTTVIQLLTQCSKEIKQQPGEAEQSQDPNNLFWPLLEQTCSKVFISSLQKHYEKAETQRQLCQKCIAHSENLNLMASQMFDGPTFLQAHGYLSVIIQQAKLCKVNDQTFGELVSCINYLCKKNSLFLPGLENGIISYNTLNNQRIYYFFMELLTEVKKIHKKINAFYQENETNSTKAQQQISKLTKQIEFLQSQQDQLMQFNTNLLSALEQEKTKNEKEKIENAQWQEKMQQMLQQHNLVLEQIVNKENFDKFSTATQQQITLLINQQGEFLQQQAEHKEQQNSIQIDALQASLELKKLSEEFIQQNAELTQQNVLLQSRIELMLSKFELMEQQIESTKSQPSQEQSILQLVNMVNLLSQKIDELTRGKQQPNVDEFQKMAMPMLLQILPQVPEYQLAMEQLQKNKNQPTEITQKNEENQFQEEAQLNERLSNINVEFFKQQNKNFENILNQFSEIPGVDQLNINGINIHKNQTVNQEETQLNKEQTMEQQQFNDFQISEILNSTNEQNQALQEILKSPLQELPKPVTNEPQQDQFQNILSKEKNERMNQEFNEYVKQQQQQNQEFSNYIQSYNDQSHSTQLLSQVPNTFQPVFPGITTVQLSGSNNNVHLQTKEDFQILQDPQQLLERSIPLPVQSDDEDLLRSRSASSENAQKYQSDEIKNQEIENKPNSANKKTLLLDELKIADLDKLNFTKPGKITLDDLAVKEINSQINSPKTHEAIDLQIMDLQNQLKKLSQEKETAKQLFKEKQESEKKDNPQLNKLFSQID